MIVLKACIADFALIDQDNRAKMMEGVYSNDMLAEVYCKMPDSYTFIEGETIVAIAGIAKIWEGLAEIWVIRSKDFEKYSTRVVRKIKQIFNEKGSAYSRIQALCPADDLVSVRFLEWIGLSRESRLVSYGPDGTDFYMYARILCK